MDPLKNVIDFSTLRKKQLATLFFELEISGLPAVASTSGDKFGKNVYWVTLENFISI